MCVNSFNEIVGFSAHIKLTKITLVQVVVLKISHFKHKTPWKFVGVFTTTSPMKNPMGEKPYGIFLSYGIIAPIFKCYWDKVSYLRQMGERTAFVNCVG
jgi:hypothetical protein